MPYLVAAVTVSTLLSVLALTLALGLTRRIRVLSAQLANLGELGRNAVSFGRDRVLAPDTVVPEFAATTTDAASFDSRQFGYLPGEWLLGTVVRALPTHRPL